MRKMTHLLTPAQAATLLGVSVGQVTKYVDAGLLRGFRLPCSSHRRIPLEELQRFAAEYNVPLNDRAPKGE